MNKYLIKLADHLDKKGFHKEAEYVDWILKKSSSDESLPQDYPSLISSNIPDEIKEKIWNHMLKENFVPEEFKNLTYEMLKELQFSKIFYEVKEGDYGYEDAIELGWTDGERVYSGEI